MTVSARQRVLDAIERVLQEHIEHLPTRIHLDLVLMLDDAIATHPFVARLMTSALDPDAAVRAMLAAFGDTAAAPSRSTGTPDGARTAPYWLEGAGDLTPEQLALVREAPELIEPLAWQIGLRTLDRVDMFALLERGREGLFEAARAFVAEHEVPFECLAWCRIHEVMSAVVDESTNGGVEAPDRLVASALEAARQAAYEMLACGDVLDDHGEPEPLGVAPLEQLERYLGAVMTSAMLAVVGVVQRAGLKSPREND